MTKVHAEKWVAHAARIFVLSATLALAACGGGEDDSQVVGYGVKPDAGGQALPGGKAVEFTRRDLDVAIEGEGAFVFQDPLTGTTVFSRLGHFDLDPKGRLINNEGWLVDGLSTGQRLSTVDALAPLAPVNWFMPPRATSKLLLELNLDARQSRIDLMALPSGPIDFNDRTTYNSATSIIAYDELGQDLSLTLYFQKIDTDIWRVYAGANGVPVNADGTGHPQAITTLVFQTDGSAPINNSNPSLPLSPIVFAVPSSPSWSGATTHPIANVSIDLSGLHQYPAWFGVTNAQQDGYSPGQIAGVSILSSGHVKVSYNNGQVDLSRRLVLARPTVADRLHRYGLSGWTCGRGCTQPVVDYPGGSLTGTLLPQALNATY